MIKDPMAEHDRESDDELLLRLHSGDEQAFAALYRRRQAAIYRYALNMSGSAAVAEDVLQEVFMVLIREGCGYDPERGALSAYLFGIARKLLLRHFERIRGNVPIDDEDAGSVMLELAVDGNQLSDLARSEGIAALRRAVQALPRRYREVVVLCDLEELDYADAAHALGCPVGTVRSRLHRARALLLEKMQGEAGPRRAGALNPIRCSI